MNTTYKFGHSPHYHLTIDGDAWATATLLPGDRTDPTITITTCHAARCDTCDERNHWT